MKRPVNYPCYAVCPNTRSLVVVAAARDFKPSVHGYHPSWGEKVVKEEPKMVEVEVPVVEEAAQAVTGDASEWEMLKEKGWKNLSSDERVRYKELKAIHG